MTIQIKLFALAKDIVGASVWEFDQEEPITIGELREKLMSTYPEFRTSLPSIRFAVNSAYANDDTVVTADDEVAIIPPVSGG